MAEESPDSRNQIQRFIRLTELIPELLDMADKEVVDQQLSVLQRN